MSKLQHQCRRNIACPHAKVSMQYAYAHCYVSRCANFYEHCDHPDGPESTNTAAIYRDDELGED